MSVTVLVFIMEYGDEIVLFFLLFHHRIIIIINDLKTDDPRLSPHLTACLVEWQLGWGLGQPY